MDQSPSPTDPAAEPAPEGGRASRGRTRRRAAAPSTPEVSLTGRVAGGGLRIERRFTREGVHPFDEVTWELRTSSISNEKGEVVFEQRDVEVPSFWSQMATNVVVSKYFRGPLNTPRRETSVKQVISRVCDTIARWGREGGYFASEADAHAFQDELTYLVLHQRMSFNSPVWFNIGVAGTKQQASACFINRVEDTMDSILTLAHTEGMLFKYGSGTGSNLSAIRSSQEALAGGGTASGPVSFMRGFDAFAGVIKSGGTTRRAAKMVILNVDHPDVEEFITCKVTEERKAWALIDAGYDGSFTGEAYSSIFFQNSNNSVRVSDDFMRAVVDDKEWHLRAVTDPDRIIKTVRARDLMRSMAESAWHCGDPGIQYDTTINDWHTSSNSGRINASNPCCFVGATFVETTSGRIRMDVLERMSRRGQSLPSAVSLDLRSGEVVERPIVRAWVAGRTRSLAQVETATGQRFRCTYEHRFLTADGCWVPASQLRRGDAVRTVLRAFESVGGGAAVLAPPTVDTIASVELLSLEDAVEVYDVEVEGTHNFGVVHDLADAAVVVHNSEYMYLDDSACFAPETRISTPDGLRTVEELFEQQERGEPVLVTTDVHSEHDHRRLGAHRPALVTKVGRRAVHRMTLKDGRQVRATADHRFLTLGGTWKRVDELNPGVDRLEIRQSGDPVSFSSGPLAVKRWQMLGWLTGDGVFSKDTVALVFGPQERQTAVVMTEELNRLKEFAAAVGFEASAPRVSAISVQANGVMQTSARQPSLISLLEAEYGMKQGTATTKNVPSAIHEVANDLKVAYLQGLFSADGCIRANRWAREPEVMLASSSAELLRSVQLILGDLGMASRITWTHPAGRANAQGQLHLYNQQARRFLTLVGFPCSVEKQQRVDDVLSVAFAGELKEPHAPKVVSILPDGEADVYDITEPVTHTVIAEGLIAHNCNLASLNLMTFVREDGTFDVEAYRHAVHMTITAQEILVGNAEYPTPKIAENSYRFRPLGLGYANLGALLMARGVPYDSPQGRELAACVTAIMTGEAYAQSARVAREIGPFDGYPENRQPMLRVIGKHREAAYRIPDDHVEGELLVAARRAWDEAHELGAVHGYRNGQATVLAPTGCLTPDTLVTTSRGLVRLRSLGNPLGDKWQDLDVEVATHEGPRKASKFFVNGVEPVVTVLTSRGYRIRGTTTHRLKVVDTDGEWQWRRLADVKAGDRLPLMLGGLVGEPVPVALPPLPDAYWTADHDTTAPRYVTPELAELVGYFMGDGSLHSKGLRLCVSPQDGDLAEHLADLGRRLFAIDATITRKKSYLEVALTSVRLTIWWEACGFAKLSAGDGHRGKGWLSHVPDAILHTNNPAAYAAFVRGLFEADGTVSTGYPSFTTVTESLARDVQSLLLALGFVTTLDVQRPGPGSWGVRAKYRLRLLNVATAARFADEVGFVSARKRALCGTADHRQSARYDHVPMSRVTIDALAPVNDDLRKTLLMEHRRTGTVTRTAATALLERTHDATLQQALSFFYDEVASATLGEEDLTLDISVPDNVTYVANGFVSHNTIGFMMDCDTTGVEPDIALVKYKKLVGGGMLKIVNQTVPQALRRLGYGEAAVQDIVAYIDANDTIEGAPHLREEDLAVFDCAFKPHNGSRSIAWQGHVRMMSAVQPFLSGAISKTVNMPQDSTVEDVEQAYMDGWRLGLKALAIYRDASKRSQPMATSIAKTTGAKVTAEPSAQRPLRRRLPAERQAITHKFAIADHEGYITVGLYEDGTPGEIFLKMAKEGSTVSGLMDSFATAVSMALQYGVPLQALCTKFSHARFEPSGFTGNPEIPIAKSIMDYIFRWLASRFLSWEERDALGIIRRDGTEPGEEPAIDTRVAAAPVSGTTPTASAAPAASVRNDVPVVNRPAPMAFLNQEDAPSCSECGSLMVRSGACYKCLNCGATSGCS